MFHKLGTNPTVTQGGGEGRGGGQGNNGEIYTEGSRLWFGFTLRSPGPLHFNE